MCEKYNGWTNRETWALNLWLTNDQGLYEMTRERVRDGLDGAPPRGEGAARVAGEIVHELWDELTDPDDPELYTQPLMAMVKDVGSDYRVDWDEIGAYWLSDIEES